MPSGERRSAIGDRFYRRRRHHLCLRLKWPRQIESGPNRLDPIRRRPEAEAEEGSKRWPQTLRIKAQKLLDDLVGKSLELVRNPIPLKDRNTKADEGGIKLFSKAPRGIQLDPIDPYALPLKRPRILPGEEIDEKSKKFRRQLRSVAVDGTNIMAAVRDACQRSIAKDAAAKAKAKIEEERVGRAEEDQGREVASFNCTRNAGENLK